MANVPHTYGNEVYANGLQNIKPAISFNPPDWETQARDLLSADSYNYIWGSAGLRKTDTDNRDAFRKWALIPSRLVCADFPSLKTTVLGHEYDYPIAVAPIGVQRIFHRDGEVAAAQAASAQRVPYILSTASSTSIEDVAAASGDGARWYQLYWPPREHDEITVSLLQRAKCAGYRVLVVTLDTYILGWRPSDLNNGYNPFLRADKIGVELGFSDPVFRRRFRERHGVEVEEDMGVAAAEWAQMIFPGRSHAWEEIGFLQAHWDGPIVLKGIQSVADARRAVEVGVQGIVEPNHGGRQQDGAIRSLDVLPEIVDAVGDRLEVLFDSGGGGGCGCRQSAGARGEDGADRAAVCVWTGYCGRGGCLACPAKYPCGSGSHSAPWGDQVGVS